jgi:hypothetical protein
MLRVRQRYLTTDQIEGIVGPSSRRMPKVTTYRITKGPINLDQLHQPRYTRTDWEPLEFELESLPNRLRVRPYANLPVLDDLIERVGAPATMRHHFSGLVIHSGQLPIDDVTGLKLGEFVKATAVVEERTGTIIGWSTHMEIYPLALDGELATILEQAPVGVS